MFRVLKKDWIRIMRAVNNKEVKRNSNRKHLKSNSRPKGNQTVMNSYSNNSRHLESVT